MKIDIYIYDCVCTYNETIIMFGMLVNDDVILLVEFVVTSVFVFVFVFMFVFVSVPTCSPQDIYYTSIPSLNLQLGDAVDCSMMVSYWYR